MNKQISKASIVLDKPLTCHYDFDSWFILISAIIDNRRSVGDINNYYFILHDKDTEKLPHVHLVVELTHRIRKSTIINRLVENQNNIDILTAECISVREVFNMGSICRYLTHKDDPNKYQYLDENVITNNRDKYDFYVSNRVFNNIFSTEDLLDAIDTCNNRRELLQFIGLENYNKYIRVINEMWFYKHNDLK